MTQVLLALCIGLLGMMSDNFKQEFGYIKTSTVATATISHAGVPPREAEPPAPVVTMAEVGQEIPPGMSELPNTATVFPQIGLAVFFLLSVFAVLHAAQKSPKW